MPIETPTTYDVFISYSRLDRQPAVTLEKALAERTLSNGQRVKVFRDERNLSVGEHVGVALPANHYASAVVIVLWSDNAAKSRWVYDEAVGAIFGLKYYPLMLDGFDPKKLSETVRPINAGRLSTALAEVDALIAEIERRKKARLPSKLKVDIHNSMPTSGQGDILIGREAELAMLRQAWAEGQTNMVVLNAMGGTGKSALINRFLADLANQGWGGAECVYAWSFYSQGTDDKRQGDADGFFDTALQWFGYKREPVKGAERGRRLAALVRERRTLLVLDGVEPLQYPAHSPGLEGKLKDDGLAALLKALADQMHGLVIVTTRIPIPELKTRTEPAVIWRELNQLSIDAGVTLLKALGVRADEDDFREVVGLLKGHALSLNLLATYANSVTNHLLPSRAEIGQLLLDPALGEQSYVMMRRYEILLEERAKEQAKNGEADDGRSADRQLAVMYLVGLFDRPVEKEVIDVLLDQPIAGLTDPLDDLAPTRWKLAVDALRRLKLLMPEGKAGEIDAHPLIREYFGRRLKETRPEAYQAANARLYEHFKLRDIPEAYREPVPYGLVALLSARGSKVFHGVLGAMKAGQFASEQQYLPPPVLRDIVPERLQVALDGIDSDGFTTALGAARPDTVKAMEPLFAAIAHGCAAGLHDAAFYEVYLPRVKRGGQHYSTRKLGAFGADLSALAHFFEQPFVTPSRNLAEYDQSLVLAEAAFRLRALGRLSEAVEPMAAALERSVTAKDWRNASTSAGNLSEARLAIGHIGGAVTAAAEAVRHADAMADDHPSAAFRRLVIRAKYADALHSAGDLDAATALFADAERRQAARQKGIPILTLHQGYWYCDLLFSRGEAAEVRRRASKSIKGARRNNWLLDIGLDTVSLGRVALALGDIAQAAAKLDAAVTALEDAGYAQELPRGLLARVALHRTLGNWGLAASDLNATDEIADRSGLKLFQIDSAIERARLTLARDGAAGVTVATGLIAKAKDLIEETRSRDHEGKERFYAQPLPGIALVEARVAILSGTPDAARASLAEAKRWIDRGWKIHAPECAELTAGLDGNGTRDNAVTPAPMATPPTSAALAGRQRR
jgi:hypothetical protein